MPARCLTPGRIRLRPRKLRASASPSFARRLRPGSVDYADPALPPGMNVEKIRDGISLALKQVKQVKQVTGLGWRGDPYLIRPDEVVVQTVERQLAFANYNSVVIGAGGRLPPKGLVLFEAVINAIHRGAPAAAIAFNTRPEDSADAAARWLPPR